MLTYFSVYFTCGIFISFNLIYEKKWYTQKLMRKRIPEEIVSESYKNRWNIYTYFKEKNTIQVPM